MNDELSKALDESFEKLDLQNQLASQKELINSLLEVVEFYGDENSWLELMDEPSSCVQIDDEDTYKQDGLASSYYCFGGKKAREMLASDMVREFRGMNTMKDEMLKMICLPKEELLKLSRIELVVHLTKVDDAIKIYGKKDFLIKQFEMVDRLIEKKRKNR